MLSNTCVGLRCIGTRARSSNVGTAASVLWFPITPTIAAILGPLQGHHSEFVFTPVAKRTHQGELRGRRYPLTLFGVNSAWKRLRKTAGVCGFRFHDFRHDFGTKLLRETGNLKLVQRHSIIRTSRARCDPPMC